MLRESRASSIREASGLFSNGAAYWGHPTSRRRRWTSLFQAPAGPCTGVSPPVCSSVLTRYGASAITNYGLRLNSYKPRTALTDANQQGAIGSEARTWCIDPHAVIE